MSTVYVESVGQGPALVLLHGWALHAGLFAPILPALAKRFRVHAVDLPGHGFAGPIRPWTLDNVVAALERTFAAETAPVGVLGWSLGGAVALHWALTRPARIRELVLVATTPKFVADASWPHAMAPETLARFADELRSAWALTLQRFLSLQVQGCDAGRATLAVLRRELLSRGAPDPVSLEEALTALGAYDLRGRAHAVAQRALVIGGERDALVPAEAVRWLARALPAGRLLMLPGAAHAPFLSHRDAFLAALNANG